jgi:hypothetical protein
MNSELSITVANTGMVLLCLSTETCLQKKEQTDTERNNMSKLKYLSEYLNSEGITYQQYLQSEHWQDVRRR